MKHILLLFGLPFVGGAVRSQSNDSTVGSWALSARAEYGFVIAHRPALRPLQVEHSKGFELSFAKVSTGKKEWERAFMNPAKGLTLAVIQTGTPRLGTGIAIYPWIDFPLNQNTKSRLDFRYGLGLGWIENTFNAEDNYKNAAIGSHINGVIHFDLHFETKLSKRSTLEIGAGITHFSNAAIKLPNLGVNIATANLAYTQIFGNNKALAKAEHADAIHSNEWSIYIAAGSKEIYPPQGNSYGAGVISVLRLHRYSNRSSWGIGHDLFYDKSLQVREARLNWEAKGFTDNIRGGIYGTYYMSAGQLGLLFGMGAYYFSRWKEDGFLYHRIGLRYSFEKLFVCMNLKTHFARADFLELGLGYRFIHHQAKK